MFSPSVFGRVFGRIGVAAAVLAGMAGGVHAQCELDVKATPKVIMPGQSAKVNVMASFPLGAYAFAASDFSVSAGTPSWSFVTDGFVAGADVVGINPSQAHAPQLGILADPANPYNAWTGKFTPASYAPAYIEIKATPNSPADFWYYPSPLTSSAAQCEVRGSETGVFVNPVRLGEFAAAPGAGGTIRTARDSFVATGGEDGVLMGLLLPAVNGARETSRRASATVQTSRVPMSLKFNGEVSASGDRPTDSLSINFTKIEFKYTPLDGGGRSYDVNIDGLGAESVKVVLCMPDGQRESVEPREGRLPFRVANVPGSVVSSIDMDPHGGYVSLGWHFSAGPSGSGHAGGINVLMMDGSVRAVSGISVQARHTVANNLRQIGLASLNFESTGAESLTVTPKK